VVDDDAALAEMLSIVLRNEGFEPIWCAHGDKAFAAFRDAKPDLVLLDLMLPGRDGVDVCRDIRAESGVPIVMLTAKDSELDKVVGLELGADDYVTKPFELPELVARIKAVLRRSTAGLPEGAISIAGLEIDPAGFSVRKGGEDVALTATEFRLLLELARRPKQVFTRELLLELVWNYDYLGDSRLVDVAVQRLRGKIEDDPAQPKLIQTVRGVGYRFGQG
jgi:two-component system response regulator MtrA